MRARVVFLFVTALYPSVPAQTLPPEETLRGAKWDGAHGVVFFGMGAQKRTGLAIRAYNFDNSKRGSDLDIYKDFPDAEQIFVRDIAAGANGTTTLSVVLNYGPKGFRYVLATYGAGGALQSVWDTNPYFVEAVTTGDAGDVFALGDMSLRQGRPKRYPVITEYDAGGRLVRRFLSSKVFGEGGAEFDHASSVLTYLEGELYLYAAPSNEVVVSKLDGTVVVHSQLDKVRNRIARADKTDVLVDRAAFLDNHRIIVDVYDYIAAENARIGAPKTFLVDFRNQRFREIEVPKSAELHPFREGQAVVLEGLDRGASIQPYSIPEN